MIWAAVNAIDEEIKTLEWALERHRAARAALLETEDSGATFSADDAREHEQRQKTATKAKAKAKAKVGTKQFVSPSDADDIRAKVQSGEMTRAQAAAAYRIGVSTVGNIILRKGAYA